MLQISNTGDAPEVVSPVEVTLNGKVYVTNTLTGNQNKALAKLALDSNVNDLLKMLFGEEGINAVGLEFVTTALNFLGTSGLERLLSILLVPKDAPRYREDTAAELLQYVGDLENPQIWAILSHFFTKNLSFLAPIMKFSKGAEIKPMESGATQPPQM